MKEFLDSWVRFHDSSATNDDLNCKRTLKYSMRRIEIFNDNHSKKQIPSKLISIVCKEIPLSRFASLISCFS